MTETELESKTNWWAILEAIQEHWLGSFLLNSLGYALIILPAALLIRRLKDSPSIRSGGCSLRPRKVLNDDVTPLLDVGLN